MLKDCSTKLSFILSIEHKFITTNPVFYLYYLAGEDGSIKRLL